MTDNTKHFCGNVELWWRCWPGFPRPGTHHHHLSFVPSSFLFLLGIWVSAPTSVQLPGLPPSFGTQPYTEVSPRQVKPSSAVYACPSTTAPTYRIWTNHLHKPFWQIKAMFAGCIKSSSEKWVGHDHQALLHCPWRGSGLSVAFGILIPSGWPWPNCCLCHCFRKSPEPQLCPGLSLPHGAETQC